MPILQLIPRSSTHTDDTKSRQRGWLNPRVAVAGVALAATALVAASSSGIHYEQDSYLPTATPLPLLTTPSVSARAYLATNAAGSPADAEVLPAGKLAVHRPWHERTVRAAGDYFHSLLADEAGLAAFSDYLREQTHEAIVSNEDISINNLFADKTNIWGALPARAADDWTDRALTSAAQYAERLSFVRSVEIDYRSEVGGRKWHGGVSALGSLHEGDNSAFAWQLRGYGADEDATGVNAGLIYRVVPNGASSLFGVNVFFDYEDGEYGAFKRWSVGGEYRSAWFDVFANRYEAITSPIEQDDGTTAYTKSGSDIALHVHSPGASWLTGGVTYYNFEGEMGDADEDGIRYHISADSGFLHGVDGLQLYVEFDSSDSDGSSFGGGFSYRHTIGSTAAGRATSSAGDYNPADYFYAPVQREWTQRIGLAETPGGAPMHAFAATEDAYIVDSTNTTVSLTVDSGVSTTIILDSVRGSVVTDSTVAMIPAKASVIVYTNVTGRVTLIRENAFVISLGGNTTLNYPGTPTRAILEAGDLWYRSAEAADEGKFTEIAAGDVAIITLRGTEVSMGFTPATGNVMPTIDLGFADGEFEFSIDRESVSLDYSYVVPEDHRADAESTVTAVISLVINITDGDDEYTYKPEPITILPPSKNPGGTVTPPVRNVLRLGGGAANGTITVAYDGAEQTVNLNLANVQNTTLAVFSSSVVADKISINEAGELRASDITTPEKAVITMSLTGALDFGDYGIQTLTVVSQVDIDESVSVAYAIVINETDVNRAVSVRGGSSDDYKYAVNGDPNVEINEDDGSLSFIQAPTEDDLGEEVIVTVIATDAADSTNAATATITIKVVNRITVEEDGFYALDHASGAGDYIFGELMAKNSDLGDASGYHFAIQGEANGISLQNCSGATCDLMITGNRNADPDNPIGIVVRIDDDNDLTDDGEEGGNSGLVHQDINIDITIVASVSHDGTIPATVSVFDEVADEDVLTVTVTGGVTPYAGDLTGDSDGFALSGPSGDGNNEFVLAALDTNHTDNDLNQTGGVSMTISAADGLTTLTVRVILSITPTVSFTEDAISLRGVAGRADIIDDTGTANDIASYAQHGKGDRTYSVSGDARVVFADSSMGVLSFDPNNLPASPEDIVVTVTVADSGGNTDTMEVTINVFNMVVFATAGIPNPLIVYNQAASSEAVLSLTVNGGKTPYTVSFVTTPRGAEDGFTIGKGASDNEFVLTANANADHIDSGIVVITAEDVGSIATLTLVLDAIDLLGISPQVLNAVQGSQDITPNLSVNGGRPPYTFSIVTDDATNPVRVVDAATGELEFVTAPTQGGSANIRVQVADSTAATKEADVVINILGNVAIVTDLSNPLPVLDGVANPDLLTIFLDAGAEFYTPGFTATGNPGGRFTFVTDTESDGFVLSALEGSSADESEIEITLTPNNSLNPITATITIAALGVNLAETQFDFNEATHIKTTTTLAVENLYRHVSGPYEHITTYTFAEVGDAAGNDLHVKPVSVTTYVDESSVTVTAPLALLAFDDGYRPTNGETQMISVRIAARSSDAVDAVDVAVNTVIFAVTHIPLPPLVFNAIGGLRPLPSETTIAFSNELNEYVSGGNGNYSFEIVHTDAPVGTNCGGLQIVQSAFGGSALSYASRQPGGSSCHQASVRVTDDSGSDAEAFSPLDILVQSPAPLSYAGTPLMYIGEGDDQVTLMTTDRISHDIDDEDDYSYEYDLVSVLVDANGNPTSTITIGNEVGFVHLASNNGQEIQLNAKAGEQRTVGDAVTITLRAGLQNNHPLADDVDDLLIPIVFTVIDPVDVGGVPNVIEVGDDGAANPALFTLVARNTTPNYFYEISHANAPFYYSSFPGIGRDTAVVGIEEHNGTNLDGTEVIITIRPPNHNRPEDAEKYGSDTDPIAARITVNVNRANAILLENTSFQFNVLTGNTAAAIVNLADIVSGTDNLANREYEFIELGTTEGNNIRLNTPDANTAELLYDTGFNPAAGQIEMMTVRIRACIDLSNPASVCYGGSLLATVTITVRTTDVSNLALTNWGNIRVAPTDTADSGELLNLDDHTSGGVAPITWALENISVLVDDNNTPNDPSDDTYAARAVGCEGLRLTQNGILYYATEKPAGTVCDTGGIVATDANGAKAVQPLLIEVYDPNALAIGIIGYRGQITFYPHETEGEAELFDLSTITSGGTGDNTYSWDLFISLNPGRARDRVEEHCADVRIDNDRSSDTYGKLYFSERQESGTYCDPVHIKVTDDNGATAYTPLKLLLF